jgi:hypothetical protein
MKILRGRNEVFVFLVLILLSRSTPVFSAASAKYAGEFMAIGVGGRALGLGSSYVALANDVTAGYWNPAGLSHLQYPELILMHDERFAGLENYDYGAFAIPVTARSTLALSIIRLGIDNIANTTNAWHDLNGDGIPESNEIDYSKITYFNAADWGFYLSYANQSSKNFSYGANVKLIRIDQGTAAATGIGFDVGAQYAPVPALALGANFQDATTTLVAWNTGSSELVSPTLKLGSAYFFDVLDGTLTPTFDTDIRFEGRKFAANAYVGKVSFDFHGGLEYDYRHLVAVRAGHDAIGSFTMGGGIHLPKFDIDYAYAPFNGDDQLGSTHRISLMFIFEAQQFARRAE